MPSHILTITMLSDRIDIHAPEHPDPEVSYETLSSGVGGYIERVPLHTPDFAKVALGGEDPIESFPFDVWVDEEGLLKSLPLNHPATMLANACGWPGALFGSVVITSGVSEDGETRPLPEMQAKVLFAFFRMLVAHDVFDEADSNLEGASDEG